MRKEFFIFAAIVLAIFVIAVCGRTVLLHLSTEQLANAFPGYKVSVGNVEFRSLDLVVFLDIELKKDATNHYRVRELGVQFTPVTFFTGVIPKVYLKDSAINLSSKEKVLRDLLEFPSPKSGKTFLVNSLEISDMKVNVHTADWYFSATADGELAIDNGISYGADIKIRDMDISLLPRGLNAAEKFKLMGYAGGDISFKGQNGKIIFLKGNLVAYEPGKRYAIDDDEITVGGTLIIKDEEFLDRIVRDSVGSVFKSEESRQEIKKDLRYYDYTKGEVKFWKEGDALMMRILLDGTKGKRDFTVAFHGF